MNRYEKKALIKFTAIYFFSVAFLVVILGILYFYQQKHLVMKQSVMQMLQYMQLVVKTDFTHSENGFSHKLLSNQKIVFDIPKKQDNYYTKVFPISQKEGFILIKMEAKPIDDKINELLMLTIAIQTLVLSLLLLLSFYLAKKSLEPLRKTLKHLDSFILDLIHDLNTPATSILLNANSLLLLEIDEKKEKKLFRIKQSADTIASLYKNLEIILEQKLDKTDINIKKFVLERVEDFKMLHPKIAFECICQDGIVRSNEKALHRILDNLLSNACKYANTITILSTNDTLQIIDNGKGIANLEKIFERHYKEDHKGHGIGMHIVHRLCDNLDIDIHIRSKKEIGTEIILRFL